MDPGDRTGEEDDAGPVRGIYAESRDHERREDHEPSAQCGSDVGDIQPRGLRSPERASIVITHYQRLLDYIVPDIVHVLSKGRIVKTGAKELALELEASGYAQFQEAPVAAE